jgi:hypothetical protein
LEISSIPAGLPASSHRAARDTRRFDEAADDAAWQNYDKHHNGDASKELRDATSAKFILREGEY